MEKTESEITLILGKVKQGQPGAPEQLFGRVYKELRQRAAAHMWRERPDHTFQPTELVHEVYLRLVKDLASVNDRAHFFGAAVNLMRQILVDHARAKQAEKRGGNLVKISFDEAHVISKETADELLALDEALTKLAVADERRSKIVELHFFGGLSIEEIAVILDTSTRTVDRDLRAARVRLKRELTSKPATKAATGGTPGT